jgi:pimeloyl-ACP methyl ester carboxylesterase
MPKARLRSGLRLHYQRVGEGPDVVLVHGITGNLAIWHLHLVPALAERFRVLTYDLRGHGLSDTPPRGYSPDDMAGDLLDLLDELEIERPVVIGHSYGADVALYHAARRPDRVSAVIAIEAALPALEGVRRDGGWVGWAYWVRTLEGAGLEVPPEHRSDLRWLLRATIDLPKQWGPLKGLPRKAAPMLRLIEDTSLSEDYNRVGTLTLERLETLETPVVLMYAEESAFIDTFEHLWTHLPHVDGVLLPQTQWGHFGPLEQPEAVADQIIARLAPAATAGRVGR